MKTIIAGGRNVTDLQLVFDAVDESGFEITEVVSGCARGADSLGEDYAKMSNIPVKKFPADWDAHGRSAGFIRNGLMSSYGDALIALWDGESRGTKNMIHQAKRKGLKVYIHRIDR